jgi:indolepyruvate ferredoxin oxidoreductase
MSEPDHPGDVLITGKQDELGRPHNTSTKVSEGGKALTGIGCHFMASWMGRNTESLIQMGGEGVNWIGKSRYIGNPHVFQNPGRTGKVRW